MSKKTRYTCDLSPSNVNFGHSSRLSYDKCAYHDRLSESVAPISYRLSPHQIKNCDGCLSTLGPRSSHNGYGVSTVIGNTVAPAQELVDIDSILSNRNVLKSKCKDGKVNDIDVTRFTLQHARLCNDFLDPIASRLTNPSTNYRGMSCNRFFNLPKNPQANIYWDGAKNTQLEAKDNYRERIPRIMSFDPALPKEFQGDDSCRRVNGELRCPTRSGPKALSISQQTY